jgi:hypothetical protein
MRKFILVILVIGMLFLAGCVKNEHQASQNQINKVINNSCSFDGDCNSWEYCSAGNCVLKQGRCNTYADCNTFSQVCNSTHYCEAKEGYCMTNADCKEYEECKEDRCSPILCPVGRSIPFLPEYKVVYEKEFEPYESDYKEVGKGPFCIAHLENDKCFSSIGWELNDGLIMWNVTKNTETIPFLKWVSLLYEPNSLNKGAYNKALKYNTTSIKQVEILYNEFCK